MSSTKQTLKKVGIKILKVAGWVVLSIVTLLVVIALLIQLPAVQQKITERAVSFVEQKIGTPVSLGHVSIVFPKQVTLEDIYLQDQSGDTLLFAGKLAVNTNLWGLLRNRISLNNVSLEKLTANVSRTPDSTFNFDYIVDAFASDTVVEDTTQDGWEFAIYDITLRDIAISFVDSVEGNVADMMVGKLDIDMDEFDLAGSVIKVNDILLADVEANVIQTRAADTVTNMSAEAADTSAFAFDVGVDEVDLENIRARYEQRATGQRISLSVDRSKVVAEEIDLPSRRIALDEIALKKIFISYHQLDVVETSDNNATKDTISSVENPWQFTISKLSLEENGIQYYDFTKPAGDSTTVNFDRLWLSNLSIEAENILLHGSKMEANLKKFTVSEKSGFNVLDFSGQMIVGEQNASIDRLHFQTNNSELNMDVNSSYESLESLGESFADATLEISIQDSKLAWQDVLYFQPSLSQSLPLTIPSTAFMTMDIEVAGQVGDLSIDRLALATLTQTLLVTHGSVVGLPDMNQVRFDLQLDSLYTSAHDIVTILPDTLLPENIQLPSWISIRGDVGGAIAAPEATMAVITDMGSAFLDGHFINGDIPEYKASIEINRFNLGALLGQPQKMGSLTMQASVEGAGTELETLNTSLRVGIAAFEYEGYTYKDFRIQGTMQEYLFSGTASMDDPNINFTFAGDVDYKRDAPAYQFELELNNIDFEALNLSAGPLQAKGDLAVNLENADIQNLNGNVDIRNVVIFNGERLYRVDSLLFASINQERNTEVSINSDFLEGHFKGTVNIASLPEVLQQYFHSYYTLHDTTREETMQPQNFSFRFDLKNSDLITDILVPELESFIPGEIRGDFDSEKRDLDISIDMKRVQYASVLAEDIRFSFTSSKNELNYELTTGLIEAGPVHVPALEVSGEVAQDSINTRLIVLDSLEEEKYVFAGMFRSIEEAYRFYFDPSRVILNYEPWEVPEGNYIQFGNGNIWTHQMVLSRGSEQIGIITEAEGDSSVMLDFKQLELGSLVSMVSAQDTLLSGVLDGNVKLFPGRERGSLEANIGIDDLSIRQNDWGDVNARVGQSQPGHYNLNLAVKGAGNDMRVEGSYVTTENNPEVTVQAIIASFDLAALEPLTFGQARDMSGRLSGRMTIEGNMNSPVIRGRLRLQEAELLATYLNSRLNIQNETIFFTRSGIELDEFTIRDVNNNPVVISGNILTEEYKDFQFDLSLKANDFQLLNTTEDDNELFYGDVRINTDATIRGTSDLPIVDLRVSLSEATNFTYVVPQPESGVLQHEGIVKFVDRDAGRDPFLSSLREDLNVKDTVTTFTGIDLTAYVEIEDEETFNIVIDPVTGDQLSVRGNATLTLDINSSGDMQLSGRYELTEGTYNFTFYKLVKREFSIQPGSSISWTGDPYDAILDIRAIYEIETSPIELVSNQLTGVSQEEYNRYKQRLPFFVYMNIEGRLMTPEISFAIDMPDAQRNALNGVVYSRIREINTRESELNKQVFALLILKRFISDDPLENRAAESFESTARRSVSKILTEQLNRLSENIEGVELSFDVRSYEDYSSGQAENTTQLQLGLSKNLFNERLVVKLSGNVNLEGSQTEQDDVSDYIGDLALEYKLTEDGRLRITGFRRSDYSMIDGELIETGTGLIYIKDYNTLSELFKANVEE